MSLGESGAEEREATDSYVVFQMGEESYALQVARVREVLDVTGLTRVPGGSPALVGLSNLRGHVVPVWDLSVPFGLPATEPGGRSAAVLMVEPDPTRPSRVAGLRVDRVSDVLEFAPEDLQPPPTLGLGHGATFVQGLIKHQDRFLLVLDLDRVFLALGEGSTADEA